MSDNHYNISLISEHPTQSDIANYATLRLLALHTDPDCFGSNHKRESAFTETQWCSRISSQQDDRVVVIASSDVADADANAVPPSMPVDHDDGRQYGSVVHTSRKGEWVGTLTILGPEALLPLSFTPPKLEGDMRLGVNPENARVYALLAMWVHPAHRGRGVGKKLIEAGFTWVRQNRDPDATSAGVSSIMTLSASQTPPVKVVALQVGKGNSNARALYGKVGFREVQGMDADFGASELSEGIWMVAEVNM